MLNKSKQKLESILVQQQSHRSYASTEEHRLSHISYLSQQDSKQSFFTSFVSDKVSNLPVSKFGRYFKKEDHSYELILADNVSESEVKERNPSVPEVLSPFKMCWTFGYNKTVPLLNLTKHDSTTIAFSASHAAVIYDYSTNKAQFLQGHKNNVSSLSVDQTGQWLVSADTGDDNAVVVWDTRTCIPVATLFNLHKDGTQIVGMSPNAYYLVTLSPWVDQKLQLFCWSVGNTEPDATLDIPVECGPVRQIYFNSNYYHHFALTTDSKVLFITYVNNELILHIGCNVLTPKQGQFTASTYVPNSHLFLSATSTGQVFTWSDVEYDRSFNTFNLTNKKKVLKQVRLQQDGISNICAIDNVIAVVNYKGQLTFFDKTLCILYWIELGERLVSMSFHLEPWEKDAYDKERNEVDTNIIPNLPSDYTIERKPFFVRDLIIGTVSGKIRYVNYRQKSRKELFETADGPITAIDVMPSHVLFCCGNAAGYCMLFDFINKILLLKRLLKNEEQSLISQTSAINYIKYSPSGSEVAVGKADGQLWILDPLSLKPKPNRPVVHTLAPIFKIIFSYDSKYLAHADYHQCVNLYVLTAETIMLLGIYKAHYKPITDILFLKDVSLLSIGEDGKLLQFNIAKSFTEKNLVVESIHRVEQSAAPLCMLYYPLSTIDENLILIANSEFKYRLILESNKKCCKTTLTHVLNSPVSCMEVLPSCSNYLVFATDNHIGIQKLPLDGNPYKSLAFIGSPSKIIKICISSDGSYLFTLGINGENILMWDINTKCVDYYEWTGGKGLDPYYCMISGGRTGDLWEELVDFFAVAQILHQGEHPSILHMLSNQLPVCELTDVMRAVGFFPTEQEIRNMYYEVLSVIQSELNTECKHTIKFEDFIRLYINHRNALGLTKEQLEEAFLTFSDEEHLDDAVVLKTTLFNILTRKGEMMSTQEITKCFSVLCGIPFNSKNKGKDECLPFLPNEISFKEFFSTILGFEVEP